MHVINQRFQSSYATPVAHVTLQSAGELSVGGNCQSDSWYGSNITPLHLEALVIAQLQLALPSRGKVYVYVLLVRAFGYFCEANPVGC